MAKLISFVSGAFNEVGNLEELVERCKNVMAAFPQYDYEHIIIDNASTDGTEELLRELALRYPHLKVIFNARNFGHIRSPYYALLQAKGDAVVSLASDLQDPPELIVKMIKGWEEGWSSVVGVKNSSEESTLFFTLRKIYYFFLEKLADIRTIENFTGFGLYDKKIIDYCRKIDDPYPYFRGIIAEIGLPIKKIAYHQLERKRGITKNNFYTLYDLAILGITSFSKIPLRLAVLFGVVIGCCSFLISLFYLIFKLLFWDQFTLGLAPIVIGFFFLGSIQLFFIGMIGEYIGSVYTQVKKRPLVVEKERINF